MATYVNDLRLKEIATGDESGTWGTSTNTNLELVAEAFSFGTEAITTNADTHTTTIADGATDPGRSIYLQYTGTLDSTCTITIGPNTVSKLWFIENATSGSQSIIIKQGSGATITIANGQVKAIYSDGAGSGGAMVDAFQDLSVPDLFIDDDLTFTSDSAVITFGADGDTTLTHTDGSGLTLNSTNKIMFNDASQFIQGSSATVLALGATDEIDLTATAIDVNGTMDVSGALTGTSATFTTADNTTQLTLKSTDDDAAIGPVLDLTRDSASPAVDDSLGILRFRGDDSGGNVTNYAFLNCFIEDPTDGAEDGLLKIETRVNSSSKERITINSTELVINEESADLDFRIESDANTHRLFLDAGNDLIVMGHTAGISTGGVNGAFQQIGNTTAKRSTHFTNFSADANSSAIRFAKSRGSSIGTNTVVQSGDNLGIILFAGDDGSDLATKGADILAEVDGTPGSDDMPGRIVFRTTADGAAAVSEHVRITQAGRVGIGTTAPNDLLHVNSANADAEFTLQSTNSGGDSRIRMIASSSGLSSIQFQDEDDSNIGFLNYEHSSNSMQFRTNDSEKMRISDVGDVFIGTTTNYGGKLHVARADNEVNTYFVSTDADGSAGPIVRLYRASPSPADDDVAGRLDFTANNDASPAEEVVQFRMTNTLLDVSDAGEHARMDMQIMEGALRSALKIDGLVGIVANEDSRGSFDFRIESNSNTHMFFLDSGANAIGINTDTPDGLFHIQSASAGTVTAGTGADELVLENNANGGLSILSAATTAGQIFFGDPDDNNVAMIQYHHADDIMEFTVNANEAMRISSGGILLVNTSTTVADDMTANACHIASNATTTTPTLIVDDSDSSVESGSICMAVMFSNDNSFSGGKYISFRDLGGEQGSVSGDGAGSVAYNTSSDMRLKTNIQDTASQWDTIKALQVRDYEWIANGNEETGFIAQEIYEQIPKVVHVGGEEAKKEPWAVDYGRITPQLTKALQEAMARIETLETELTKLKGGS